MADKSMKAVIWAEFDPRGVVKGVAAANTELAKLNKTSSRVASAASVTAAINVAQMGLSALQTVIGAIDRRFSQLSDITQRYSAAAGGAAAQGRVNEIIANMRIAKALEQGSIEATQAKEAAKLGEASRLERNSQQMVQGMGAMARFQANFGSIVDILTEGAGMGLAGLEQMTQGNLRQGLATLGGAAAATTDELLTASNFAYAPTAPGRGMQTNDQMQTEYLRQIAKAVGQ
jgi:carbon monoxide dehydrogenase subunit G